VTDPRKLAEAPIPYCEFSVLGQPVPQGSKRAFGRNVVEIADARLRSWRQDIAVVANEAMAGTPPTTRPVLIQLDFHFDRPKGHYGTGRNAGNVRPTAPVAPGVKPDLDKLVRAALDALTGVVFKDDALVVSLVAAKIYVTSDTRPGLYCRVFGFA
jgi:Holliday junction resolvase RusA-like endonuclease